jgi:hypothetical protein
VALLAALAVLASAGIARTAEPAPHWFVEGKLLVGSLTINSKGRLALTVYRAGPRVVCTVFDTETIANPSNGEAGTDEMTSFSLQRCKGGCGASAAGLPWHSHLVVDSKRRVIRDEIEGVELSVSCQQTGPFTAGVRPIIRNSALHWREQLFQLGKYAPNFLYVDGADGLVGPTGVRDITVAVG